MLQEVLISLVQIDHHLPLQTVQSDVIDVVRNHAGFASARLARDDPADMLASSLQYIELGEPDTSEHVPICEMEKVVLPFACNLLRASAAHTLHERRRAENAKVADELAGVHSWISATHALGRMGRYRFNLSKDFLWWSDQIFEFYGLTPHENREGRERFRQRIHPDDREKVYGGVVAASAQNLPLVYAYRLKRPDGSIRHLLSCMAPDVAGEHGDYFGVNIDVTDRAILAEEVRTRRADLDLALRLTTLGELSASMTHDLAQPLTAIVASAGAAARWLGKDKPELSKARNTLDELTRYRRRATSIVERLRDFAKRTEPTEEPVDVASAFLEVVPLVESEATRRAAFVTKRLVTSNDIVIGDRDQLQQLFLSLALVAMKDAKASEDGKALTLCTDGSTAGRIKLTASFEVEELAASGGITVIGSELWLCEKITRAHGGTLNIEEAAGHRSITIALPKAPSSGTERVSALGGAFLAH